MQWPAVSQVVSPIEHIWDELARRVRNYLVQPQNLQKLEAALLYKWDNIPMQTFPIWFIPCVGDVLRLWLQMVDIHDIDFGDFFTLTPVLPIDSDLL